MLYFKEDGSRLICLLCSHYCKLTEGQKGICGVNQNINGEIKNLVYGHIAAVNIDPVEKKPLYHFMPSTKTFSLGTIGCNFKCPFCQNWGISQEKTLKTKEFITPLRIVQSAIANKCDSISFTYNEPTIFYPYARDTALLAKQNGLKTIFVTNGFESREVIEDMKGIIDACNVDLKSFDTNYYKKELGGGLLELLVNLKTLVKNGIWVEVTTLIVPTKNDSNEELKAIASFIAKELGEQVPWHISAFHPDFKEQSLPRTPTKTLQKAHTIGKEAGLKHVYIGNAGIENSTYCPNCNSLLIRRSHFNVLENHLSSGHCHKCQTKLAGVFE